MVTIGIDPSINSTGICVNEDGNVTYYIVTSKMTKKMKEFNCDYIKLLPYSKRETKDLEYTDKESAKAFNLHNICFLIGKILTRYNPDKVYMEGVSYGSVGSAALVDLAGLNFVLRSMFIDLRVSFEIVSPTQNKKFATGNGGADKGLMMDAWRRLDRRVTDIKDIKVDDLADAYFLAHFKP